MEMFSKLRIIIQDYILEEFYNFIKAKIVQYDLLNNVSYLYIIMSQ